MSFVESDSPANPVMGRDLTELFTALSEDLTWMSIRWGQYRKLFVDKSADLDVLNSTAPFFFWVIQRVLWEDTLLGLTRLSAPPKSAGRSNLTVRRIPALLPDGTLKSEVLRMIAELDAKTKFAFDWRHRQLAHRDLDLAFGRAEIPLKPVDLNSVEAALDQLAAILNVISQHYSRSTTAYRSASVLHDAEELYFYLKAGLKRERIRSEKLERGEYDQVDWDD